MSRSPPGASRPAAGARLEQRRDLGLDALAAEPEAVLAVERPAARARPRASAAPARTRRRSRAVPRVGAGRRDHAGTVADRNSATATRTSTAPRSSACGRRRAARAPRRRAPRPAAGPFSQPLRSCSPQMHERRARDAGCDQRRQVERSRAPAARPARPARPGPRRAASAAARRDVEAVQARHADEPAEDEPARQAGDVAAGVSHSRSVRRERAVKRHARSRARRSSSGTIPTGEREHHRRHRPLGRPGDRERRAERVARHGRPLDADLVDGLGHEPHGLGERERRRARPSRRGRGGRRRSRGASAPSRSANGAQ